MAEALGYRFRDPSLLELALTHRSFCAEHDDVGSNERLEFLGDAVLGMAVTGFIYQQYPDLPEGQLAKLRASVVSTETLARLAEGLGLGDFVRLGKGEELSGGREKVSILADAFEAIVGAVFLDSDFEVASAVVVDLTRDEIRIGATRPGRSDFKTQLQELAAQQGSSAPTYSVESSGPDHDRLFQATVQIDGADVGAGSGSSKKRAEQAAAEAAWRVLTGDTERKERTDANV